ncbi:TetR/AcrR family transcriptional regulator [Streptomyces solicathayae]|uniref:TetR/AcrR family transcriptional regulator n=1 Tax=Streptomyces solicathayae TaxID=3081768 RepID=A0ABZ0LPP6_9ACTN|nr:TetR/AcrR family transcriptional regulator [Streptomyces sp. HUAS YS2]WOX20774.1 TetR/AcrR family transcriptional regulator [Streptomyces sp. HUAS YS2]
MVENPVTSQLASRPAPVQRRGVLRAQAILDAAEQILAEEGYEASTLGAIGKRAGIPTPSVYHYFADRNEVDAALLERHSRDIDALVAEAADDPELGTLREVIDALVDPQIAYCREHPGVVELWYAPGRSPMLVELEEAWGRAQAERLWRYLRERELIAEDTPLLAVEVAYEAADRIFGVAFQRSETGDQATVDEARRLMTAYLETYAPEAPKTSRRRR